MPNLRALGLSVSQIVRSAEESVDRRAAIWFLLLVLVVSAMSWGASLAKPIWFDEALGLAAALAPRVGDIPAALALPVDINPPLHHLVMRLSVNIFGWSSEAARFPSLLGMLTFLFCLYQFVARRLKAHYGLFAALLVVSYSGVFPYAWEARPYGLLLGFTGVALLSYQRLLERNNIWAYLLLALCCACFPLTHYYGVLIVGPFVASELFRAIERRQVDWKLLIGIVAPPGVGLFLLRDMIRDQQAAIVHMHSQASSVMAFTNAYELYEIPAWAVGFAIAGLVLIYCLPIQNDNSVDHMTSRSFSGSELVLALALLFLPVAGMIAAKLVTRIYVARYFMAASAGLAILVCQVVASLRRRPGIVLVLSVVLGTMIARAAIQTVRYRHAAPPIESLLTSLRPLQQPILFEDAKDYLMARQFDPQMGPRLYYAAEPEIAQRTTGTDSDDKLMIALAKMQPVQVVRLNELTRKGEQWIVVPGNFGWLMGCLNTMRMDLRLVNSNGPPPRALYLTQFKPQGIMQSSWCEVPRKTTLNSAE